MLFFLFCSADLKKTRLPIIVSFRHDLFQIFIFVNSIYENRRRNRSCCNFIKIFKFIWIKFWDGNCRVQISVLKQILILLPGFHIFRRSQLWEQNPNILTKHGLYCEIFSFWSPPVFQKHCINSARCNSTFHFVTMCHNIFLSIMKNAACILYKLSLPSAYCFFLLNVTTEIFVPKFVTNDRSVFAD